MTYRERRERKADRLREWADKRTDAAEAVFKAGEPYTSDYAFNTQPGHIPLRARIIAREDRAFQSLRKAHGMSARADGIEAAADKAIYSDDEDATERLEERIADLEGQRDRIKAFNVSCRKGARDVSLLDEKQQRDIASIANVCAYQLGKGGAFPSYALSNLSGNIKRQKDRLAELRNPRPVMPRLILLRFAGDCHKCGRRLERGTSAEFVKATSTVACYPECA